MRVKTEAKRQSILAIAGPMFLEEGFAEVSMSAVAARIGGSKSTLYNYFSSKEALFTAFVVEAGRKRFSVLAGVELSPQGAGATLVELGTVFLELLLSPEILSINRLVIAEAIRIPQVGRIFFENGPQKVSAEFERVFGLLAERGLIPAHLVPLAARQFKSLCETDTYERCLWGIEQAVSRPTIRGTAEQAAAAIGQLYALE
ncbi:MAG: TetR/AcrR family transcriptional regulator [Devosia sp.]|nr:TetR/AcrR family transcriptional regulator [Devosia sp.]